MMHCEANRCLQGAEPCTRTYCGYVGLNQSNSDGTEPEPFTQEGAYEWIDAAGSWLVIVLAVALFILVLAAAAGYITAN